MDQPKIQRLLRLMKMLTANYDLTVDQIADRLDISRRSVYRYIDTFRSAGFIIKKTDDIIKLDKSSPYFKDISELIHFTEEEAFILKSAIESIDETNLIKQNLKKKLYTVYDYKILAETIVSEKNTSNVHNLVEAISDKKQVILYNYASANSHSIRNRLVEPFAFTTNYIQLWCFDPESQSNKLFKLARIGKVEIQPKQWQSEDLHKEGFIDIFRMNSPEVFPVQLKLSVRAANLLLEEYPLSAKYIKPFDDEHWLLQTNVCSFEGIGRFVLGLMDEIEILQPFAFVDYIKHHLENSEHILSLLKPPSA